MKKTNTKMVTIALFVATFLTAIEGTIVSTAMPTIISDLRGIELMNWVFSIYLLTSAVTVPVFGKLADLFGRKHVFLIGTIVFLIGSALCGLAHTMEQLILFRAIQGIGAGAVMPVTNTIIADIYPHEKRAKMLGLTSLAWGIAGVIGPLVGGFFVDQLSWHWVFYINIPFGLASILMVMSSLHESIEKTKKSIDVWGAITFSSGMLALLYGLQKAGDTHDWGSPSVIGLFACAVIFLAGFIFIETKVKEPMIPLMLFRIQSISVSNVVALLVSVVLIGLNVYIPMWVQGGLGYNATISGLMLAPMSITWMIGSFWGGKIHLSRGSRFSVALGMIVITVSMFWLALFTLHTPSIMFYLLSALMGIGFGIVVTITIISAQSSVDWSMRGAATASNIFSRNLGQSVGAAVLGTYFNASIASKLQNQPHGQAMGPNSLNQLINHTSAARLPAVIRTALRSVLESGLHHLFIIIAVVSLLGFAVSFLFPREDQPLKANGQ
ncbi:MDR family MFS transporter [Heyndrickxia acidicola]|uniref:MDR family MFS transporter n=1 Tax=Heyndrickxia acidicola TaxID=209389 RepID=A0ABU6MGA0_9BACI|nr:MDR family MFS transporter [Heyndrickxia acidicola]MED1203309.1 MDR family MFS transporter [Heyndrickxia acidicola]